MQQVQEALQLLVFVHGMVVAHMDTTVENAEQLEQIVAVVTMEKILVAMVVIESGMKVKPVQTHVAMVVIQKPLHINQAMVEKINLTKENTVTEIVNKTGKSFKWHTIINGEYYYDSSLSDDYYYKDYEFETGTFKKPRGNVTITK